MVVNNRRIPNPELSDEEKRKLYQLPKYKSDGIDHNQPFLFLTLDLPPKPLYVDPHKQISIPQVSSRIQIVTSGHPRALYSNIIFRFICKLF